MNLYRDELIWCIDDLCQHGHKGVVHSHWHSTLHRLTNMVPYSNAVLELLCIFSGDDDFSNDSVGPPGGGDDNGGDGGERVLVLQLRYRQRAVITLQSVCMRPWVMR
jgi:hypothetical protein